MIMEYMGNKDYWNSKFASREDKLLQPESSLINNIKYLKKGTVLDIACGDGRNTIFLLQNNFKVTGVDFSIKALDRLEKFAGKNNLCVYTKQIDLSSDSCINELGIYDNVVINHYRLSKEHISELQSHITSNGILFVCGFGHKHKVDSKIRKEDLIMPTDFENIKDDFELVNYIENEDSRGFFVTYVFRKM